MAMTDTWDSPNLDQPIGADLPAIQRKFQALVKGDPSLVQNPPVGAKRLVEISSGNWQVQQYNGSTWSNIGKLKMDVDTVDGYDAAITPKANTIAVRNASGKLECWRQLWAARERRLPHKPEQTSVFRLLLTHRLVRLTGLVVILITAMFAVMGRPQMWWLVRSW